MPAGCAPALRGSQLVALSDRSVLGYLTVDQEYKYHPFLRRPAMPPLACPVCSPCCCLRHRKCAISRPCGTLFGRAEEVAWGSPNKRECGLPA